METKILVALVIGISVPDVYAASERFEKYDVEFIKRPDDGSMKVLLLLKIQMAIGLREGIAEIIHSQ